MIPRYYQSGEEILVGDLVQLVKYVKQIGIPIGSCGLVVELVHYPPNIQINWGIAYKWNMFNRELKFIRRNGKKWMTWI